MRFRLISLLAMLLLSTTAMGATIQVVSSEIDAAADQVIDINVTGGEAVATMNLYVQVRGAALAITDLSTVGSIWESNSSLPVVGVYPAEDIPNAQFGFVYIATASGTVSASGLLCRVHLNAGGLEGQTAVVTVDTNYGKSELHAADDSPITVAATDGLITVRGGTPPANKPPIVDAGLDKTVTSGDTVTLSGHATDPEGTALNYQWAPTGSGPAVTLSDPTAASTTFTAPAVTQQTTLTFKFSASDGPNTSDDSVTITVNPPEPSDGDTGTGDTGTGDTGSGDTGTGDTGSGDTGSGDTGTSNTDGDTSGDTSGGDQQTTGGEDSAPPPPFCGFGMVESMLLCAAGLTLSAVRRRR